MSTKEIQIPKTGEISESSNFFEAKADTVVTVGTNVEGDEITTFIFLDNYPVVEYENGDLTVTRIEKRKVAAISVGKNKARMFYESLKETYESE